VVGHAHLVETMMQVQGSLGGLTANVDRLITDVGKLGDKVSDLQTSVNRFKTAIWVVGVCLTIFIPAMGGMLWWAVGERINYLLRPNVTITAPK